MEFGPGRVEGQQPPQKNKVTLGSRYICIYLVSKKKSRKHRVFRNPGFPLQTQGFIANPSFFQGLEGQDNHI